MSNGARELDGFHDLLKDQEQDMFDLACEREMRRELQGYVTPAQARAFLQAGRQLGVDPRAIAVEVNGEILQREGYADCTLSEGDTVEIVRMVGGGTSAQTPA